MIRSRINYYLNLEKERKAEIDNLRREMAIDFHDEMGNHLASIITLANTLQYKLQEQDKQVTDIVGKIENSSKVLYKGTKEFIWSIDPQSDNLNELLTYLRDYGVEYFANTSIEFEVGQDFILQENNHKLATGTSRQIVGIFKEAMTNCLKHSNSNKATLCLNKLRSSRNFHLSFTDDGIGFDKDTARQGRGLLNIMERAAKIGKQLHLATSTQGTTITLEI